jgi:hypothetical protein
LLLTNIVFPLGCPVGLVLFLTANADKTGPTGSQGRTERSEGGRPEGERGKCQMAFRLARGRRISDRLEKARI